MPTLLSNLLMGAGTRHRNLPAPINTDEPARLADISAPKVRRIFRVAAATGTVTINWALYDEARLVLTGPVTLAFTGATDGQGCTMKLTQDATGNRIVTLPASVRFSTDVSTFSNTLAAGKKDRIGFIFDADDSKYDFVSVIKGF